jgi:hypothetical protein
MASPAPAREAYLDPDDYPAAWIWDDDGDRVGGSFVRFDRGHTRQYGDKTIVVLNVDGVERSVWLTQTVLYGKFRDELRERPSRTIEPGERITISRRGKVESENATGSYWGFSVVFHDKPAPETSDLFPDLDGPAAAKPEAETTEKPIEDDGIPY